MTLYSALEQAPLRTGTTAGQSIRDTLQFARRLDGLGLHRLWIAEHHSMGAVTSSAPEVLIGQVAAITERLRIGSGAMLLPNHRPLHVAEQFQVLEALHPGRIDLGIGRSDGASDPAIIEAFARPTDSDHGGGFERQLDELLTFGGRGRDRLPHDDPLAGIRAGPADVPLPPVYLLGSSANSAQTAAERGLGYGFAAYSNPDVAADALRHYREHFVPARAGDRPHAILGLKVVVGEDDAHAAALARPWHLSLVRHRAGIPGPMMSVEQALAHRFTDAERAAEHRVRLDADVTAGPERAAELLAEHAARAQADEIIVTTNTFDPAERLASYERLATVVGLRASVPA